MPCSGDSSFTDAREQLWTQYAMKPLILQNNPPKHRSIHRSARIIDFLHHFDMASPRRGVGASDHSVCIAIDQSPESTAALDWAVDNLVREQDQIHVVLVLEKTLIPLSGPEIVELSAHRLAHEEHRVRKSGTKSCFNGAFFPLL